MKMNNRSRTILSAVAGAAAWQACIHFAINYYGLTPLNIGEFVLTARINDILFIASLASALIVFYCAQNSENSSQH
jgi:hypothetical protein